MTLQSSVGRAATNQLASVLGTVACKPFVNYLDGQLSKVWYLLQIP